MSGVSSSPNAENVYVWGEIKGRRILQKNGKTVFEGPFTKLQIDLAGEHWAALVDESSETGERSALVVNGKTVKQIEAPTVLQELYVAASGNAWAWLAFNDDSSAAVLRLPGKQDETISGYTNESFIFSENGQRFAYSLEENAQRRWKVDGTLVNDRPSEQTKSFRLASNGAFAYIAIGEGGKNEWVTTKSGAGPNFDSIDELRFSSTGEVSYTASQKAERFLVVSSEVVRIPADSLISGSLSHSKQEVTVIGLRGREVIKFSVQTP